MICVCVSGYGVGVMFAARGLELGFDRLATLGTRSYANIRRRGGRWERGGGGAARLLEGQDHFARLACDLPGVEAPSARRRPAPARGCAGPALQTAHAYLALRNCAQARERCRPCVSRAMGSVASYVDS